MYPIVLRIGPVTIYSFGVLMATAFLVGGWVFKRELERKRILPGSGAGTADVASSIVLWAALGGLVGARLLFILQELPEFLRAPGSLIFSGAGFVWYGGLLGGLGAVSWFIRKKGLAWLEVADAAAPALAIAYGIGRIGCHVAGDGDWGTVTTVAWGVSYPNAVVGWPYPAGVQVHPTPIYELFGAIVIFGILKMFQTKKPMSGGLFWSYLVLASAARFLVEFWRINLKVFAGLTQAQLFGIALFLIGSFFLWRPQGLAPRWTRKDTSLKKK